MLIFCQTESIIHFSKVSQVVHLSFVCVPAQALVRTRFVLQSSVMPISPNSCDSMAIVTEIERYITEITQCWIAVAVMAEFLFLASCRILHI